MKVILQQEAEFELNVEKNIAIPMNTFLSMAGMKPNENEAQPQYPVVRLFKTLDEFKKEYAVNGNAYSDNADVQLLKNGQICVFRRPFSEKSDSEPATDDSATPTDAATSTETNQAE